MTVAATADTRPLITSPTAVREAAAALARGAVVGHAFANFYVLTTRPDEATVQAVNRMKGRPAGQVGSITGPPDVLTDVWDLDRLPDGLDRATASALIEAFWRLGPFGFRAPAAPWVPAHLTLPEAGTTTAQVIAPGYACPSNTFLAAALEATGQELLYITSANRSRHLTGAEDSPAHWQAAGLRAEFGAEPGFLVLEHADEAAARRRYPRFLPMSTTILGLHTVIRVPDDRRPHLVLERHGSLAAAAVRTVLADFGLGLVLGPKAANRLSLRSYREGLSDR